MRTFTGVSLVILAGLTTLAHAAHRRWIDLSANKVVAFAHIVNTGSTNTLGYSIDVQRDGVADYRSGESGRLQHAQLSHAQTRQLFHDLATAPLSQMPAGHGIKSVSFGTSVYIEYNGQRSPDLSFPANAQARALAHDVTAIAATLHLKNAPRHPVGGMVPSLPGH